MDNHIIDITTAWPSGLLFGFCVIIVSYLTWKKKGPTWWKYVIGIRSDWDGLRTEMIIGFIGMFGAMVIYILLR